MYARVKLLLAAPFLTSATPAPMPPFHYPMVHQVICDEGRGSAFRVDGGRLLSVAHVTGGTNCKIDGRPIEAVQDEGRDFAVISGTGRAGFKINCGGFIPGQWYHSVGFAGGRPWQTTLTHLASYQTADGYRVLLGIPTFIPGMSGGIVMNAAGEAVGTVNAFRRFTPLSYSVELKDTSVCAG